MINEEKYDERKASHLVSQTPQIVEKANRNDAILKLKFQEGWTCKKIGEFYNLGERQVRFIVQTHSNPAQNTPKTSKERQKEGEI